jgi:hypothetical protein
MTIFDLITGPRPGPLPPPELDVLTEPEALAEAQLIAVQLDAVRSELWLLFDTRIALQVRTGNTTVLVARGVRSFSWSADERRPGPTAWNVVSWLPAVSDRGWSLRAGFVPDADLAVSAATAELWVGDVPGNDAGPPDFTSASDAEVRAGLASWTSPFTPVNAVAV